MAQRIFKEKEVKTDGKVASHMTTRRLTRKNIKDVKQTADYSCMPEVCAIIMDLKTKRMIHSREFTKHDIFDAVFPRTTNLKGGSILTPRGGKEDLTADEKWEREKIESLSALRSHKI